MPINGTKIKIFESIASKFINDDVLHYFMITLTYLFGLIININCFIFLQL